MIYKATRPHRTLGATTPDEATSISFLQFASTLRAAREMAEAFAVCRTRVLIRGRPSVQLALEIDFIENRRHLPAVTLRQAALGSPISR